ncbi:ornithine cyclodeaminase family protein [Litorisediminicola beolgyonensis]|uniref:Ornithine cyclodeaminase family protein n=1 Tax=Litorisediminicola beolgyonensis TaxID=1173614 RepID=A0ABW3ZGA0_9RHOB
MEPRIIRYDDIRDRLSWSGAVEALRSGHLLPRAEMGDLFLGPPDATLLTRAARIEGLGYAVKSVTVLGDNPSVGLPSVQGAMFFFEPEHGQLAAMIDSRLVTEIKTAADSLLAATLLARPDSERLLIVGAGTVAASLISAYRAGFADLKQISIWARRPEQAQALAEGLDGVEAVTDLEEAAGQADIIATATMARDPVLQSNWIAPGTHVDLIGAFRADMREADDDLMARARLYVDSSETTLGHIGELIIPIRTGAITEDAVLGEFYDIVPDPPVRDAEAITVFKNGGGAHLDLMIADWIVREAAALN